MKECVFADSLWLSRPREEVFAFFTDARNLEALTPPWVGLEVVTPGVIPMGPGALIDYRIRIHGVPMRWRTEITEWEPPRRFVDVQLRGPYRRWIHEHTFIERDGGTLCEDRVRYAVLGGVLVDWLFVRRDVARIFAFRRAALMAKFKA